MDEINEEYIIRRLARWIDNRKFPYQIPRAFMYGWECDYWCLSDNGLAREFEIKTSRSDFLVDKKKHKHSDKTKGANYFYYVCPTGLINKSEVESKYGLIYVSEMSLTIEKKPRQLHGNKFVKWQMLANKMYWKWYSLWCDKYQAKEISREEWQEGFNMQLAEHEII